MKNFLKSNLNKINSNNNSNEKTKIKNYCENKSIYFYNLKKDLYQFKHT